jgi:hypothetical protein
MEFPNTKANVKENWGCVDRTIVGRVVWAIITLALIITMRTATVVIRYMCDGIIKLHGNTTLESQNHVACCAWVTGRRVTKDNFEDVAMRDFEHKSFWGFHVDQILPRHIWVLRLEFPFHICVEASTYVSARAMRTHARAHRNVHR